MIMSTDGQWKLKTTRLTSITLKGKSNILADTLSRFITIDPEMELNPEFANYKFGSVLF